MIQQQIIKYLTVFISFIISYISLWFLSLPILLVLYFVVVILVENTNLLNYEVGYVLVYIIFFMPILFAIYKFIQITFMNIEKLISTELTQSNESIIKLDMNKNYQDETNNKIIKAVTEAKKDLKCKKDIIIYRIQSNIFNAYAMSNFKKESVIAVYDGLVSSTTNEQLKSIIGHEIGHINNNDSLLKLISFAVQYNMPKFQEYSNTIMQTIQGVANKIPLLGVFVMFYGLFYQLISVLISLIMNINRFLQNFGYKQAEYIADSNGAKATSPQIMVDSLELIKKLEDEQKKENNSLLMILLSEHPSTENRIKQLEKGL